MTRFLTLAALLTFSAAPAPSQSVPTPDEVRRMERAVESLRTDSVTARRAYNRLLEGEGQGAARDAADATVREVNVRLRDARQDLATARRRVADRPAPDDEPASGEARDEGARGAARPAAEADREVPVLEVDPPAEPPVPLWKSPFVLAGLAAALALGALAAWWFTRGPGAARRRGVFVPQASRPPMTAEEQMARNHAQGVQSPFVATAQFAMLERQVHDQKREIDDLRGRLGTFYQEYQAAKAPPAPAAPVAAPAPALGPAEAAAAAFADWCRLSGPMMSRVGFFENDLRARLPGASAQAVYRDLNSQAEPVRFDGRGGASPAEFWLVTAGSEALLFPQPLNAHQFRDLTRVFDGSAAPGALQAVGPARVRDEGGAYVLTQPGRVS